MKLLKLKVAAMAKAASRGGKSYGDHYMMHPTRDWLFGFGFFLVVCVAGAVWAATVYMRYQDVSAFTVTVSQTADSSYRGGLVESALAEMETRKVVYETIKARMVIWASGQITPLEPATTTEAVVEEGGMTVEGVTDDEVLETETEATTEISIDPIDGDVRPD